MLNKILFVATYPEMRELAEAVAKQRGGVIDIIGGELFDAVKNIKQSGLADKEVIVCRGGTARLLSKTFKLPVVEVEVGGYDIIRAVYKYKNRRIAIVGADNVISGVKAVEETLDLDIAYFPFTFENEIEEKIRGIKTMNIGIVIGDTVAVRIAKQHGLEGELIRSGKESVEQAFDKADNICAAILNEREKNSRIGAIVENLTEGILLTDEHFRIVLSNRVAENLLQCPRHHLIGTELQSVLPDIDVDAALLDGSASQRLVNMKGTMLVTNITPIMVAKEYKGAAITFEDVTKIQELEQNIRQTLFKRGLVAKHRFDDLVVVSAAMRTIVDLAKRYSQVDSTVLVYGESGTGKELLAQSIHNHSMRKNGPFIAINCATLPSNLLESTLFGYDEGAFTGAKKGGKKGVFELAHNGTLFLDEISEMDMSIQSKMLRVLQEHEIMRLGGDSMVPVNVRVIAATNRPLFNSVDASQFREDLYYRISVLNIEVPPLRERRDDVLSLIRHLTELYCRKHNLPLLEVEHGVLERLHQYSWPGNVRQLENVVQKMVLLSRDGFFREADFSYLQLENREAGRKHHGDLTNGTLEAIVQKVAISVLKEEGFNKTRAAKRLGITRMTLNKYLDPNRVDV